MHLGLIVEFEMHDSKALVGRVEAADEDFVYLGRTRHRTVLLSDIKRVVSVSQR